MAHIICLSNKKLKVEVSVGKLEERLQVISVYKRTNYESIIRIP